MYGSGGKDPSTSAPDGCNQSNSLPESFAPCKKNRYCTRRVGISVGPRASLDVYGEEKKTLSLSGCAPRTAQPRAYSQHWLRQYLLCIFVCVYVSMQPLHVYICLYVNKFCLCVLIWESINYICRSNNHFATACAALALLHLLLRQTGCLSQFHHTCRRCKNRHQLQVFCC